MNKVILMNIFPLASYRKWLLGVIIVIFFVLFLVDIILRSTTCPAIFDVDCENFTDVFFVFDSGYFLKSVLLFSFALLFLSERAFKWWKWFAIASFPVLVWWIIPPGGDLFDRQAADKVSALFFLSVSILIAISASVYNFKLRKAK